MLLQASTLLLPGAFLGPSLIYMVIYVWSRNFPTSNVSIMGLFTLQAFHLPFVLAAVDVCCGNGWRSQLRGIVVGHL